jgi:serine/threonine-protein kinase HipA
VTANHPGALAVRLQGKRIGVITRLAGDRHLFAFDEAYVHDENRPTLSLSFKSSSGGLVTSVRPYNVRLPPFFSNLLPEGHLREYLAARAGVKPGREFFLLAALGADLPGAITVTAIEAAAAEEDQRRGDDDRQTGPRASPLRFSLAGIHLKFSAIMEASGGLTIPADGVGGSWVVKLPAARFEGVPENEFAMMELARSIGVMVPKLKLVPVREIEGLPQDAEKIGGHALAVERFDRKPDGGRVHMEDFAQVFGVYPDDKYERRSYANIAQVLAAETGEKGAHDFVRRLVFSVLIGNGDMHLKNWSLLYPGRPQARARTRIRLCFHDRLLAQGSIGSQLWRQRADRCHHPGTDRAPCGYGPPGVHIRVGHCGPNRAPDTRSMGKAGRQGRDGKNRASGNG